MNFSNKKRETVLTRDTSAAPSVNRRTITTRRPLVETELNQFKMSREFFPRGVSPSNHRHSFELIKGDKEESFGRILFFFFFCDLQVFIFSKKGSRRYDGTIAR